MAKKTQPKINLKQGGQSAAKIAALLGAAAILCAALIIGGRFSKDKLPSDGENTAGIVINEICACGQQSLYDEDGDYSDFIELYNPTAQAVDLSGWHITDEDTKPTKYEFTDIVIQPGEYLVIFASGKDKADGYIHTNFKLSAGERVSLYSSANVLIDSAAQEETQSGVSYGRNAENPEKWGYFSVPTPGQPNATKQFDTPADAAGRKGGPLFISEVLAASFSGEDAIEIYNMTEETVDLSGWYLSDSAADPQKWSFPEGTSVAAGSYLALFASGSGETENGVLNTNFKLSRYNDEVLLSFGGVVYDRLDWGVGRCGVSVGVNSPDDALRRYYTASSIGSANMISDISGVSPQVFFSVSSGCYGEGFGLTLYTLEKGCEIRYTTDGSTPDENSALYSEPINITKNTTVRAVSVTAGRLVSETVTSEYVLGEAHSLPVVFITVDEDDFDYIYTDVIEEVRPRVAANITLVETDGTVGFSESALISKHGNMSSLDAKKSLSVYFRETAGINELNYDLFPDDNSRVTSFKSFILRSGGNDWDRIAIKDGMLQTLGASAMDLDYQGFRSCAVYINGEYWGLYNIREKENEDYLASYYGIDPDNVDIISFGYGVHEGDYAEYNRLINFVSTADLDEPSNRQQLENMMDIDNMIDTYLMHIYYGNFDTVNIKWWRERSEGAKWRWFTYDLDYALYYPNQNNLALVTDPEGHGVNKYFSSALIYNLMQSQNFRERFLSRTETYWATIFAPDTVLSHWYSCYDLIASEVPKNLARWNISRSTFSAEMEEAYEYIVRRPAAFRNMLGSYFGLSQEELERRFPLSEVTVEQRTEFFE